MTTTGEGEDSTLIRHAWARGLDTIDRGEGEMIGAFVGRACATFGTDAIVRLANARGGIVAWTDDGGTIRPARLLPPGDRPRGPWRL